jgi:hypothetical protein
MSFINPTWLWGLTGLLVPLAIHFLSLKEGKIISIGSLRHLRESSTAQFSSIRLNELFLLLIRSILVILVVLLLAGMQLNVMNSSSSKWVVVDRAVYNNRQAKVLIDSLVVDGYEVHLLNNGFPQPSDSARVASTKNNWILARELTNKNLNDVVVISNNFAGDFRGLRSAKPSTIKWISVEPAEKKYEISTWTVGRDSTWSRIAESNATVTSFESQFAFVSNNRRVENQINISIYADDEFDYDAKILFAAVKAIDTVVPFHVRVDATIDTLNLTENDWIFWLSRDKLNTHHQNVITISTCDNANAPLFERGIEANLRCGSGSNVWWVITKRLTEDIALAENLNVKLAKVVLDGNNGLITSGQRTLADESIWSQAGSDIVRIRESNGSLSVILISLLALSLITERIVAQKRNQ